MHLLTLLIISLAVQVVLFLPAFLFRTDKLTDLSYSLSFIILAIIGFFSSARAPSHVLVLVMVVLWGVRLGSYLFTRVLKTGKDARFDGIRERFWRFLGFWLVQGVVVWTVLLASLALFMAPGEVRAWSFAGVGVYLVGLVVEAVADAQQSLFRNKAENKGKLLTGGLWRYSRHPNYFGEMLVWIGIFVFSLSGVDGWRILLAAASPASIILTLLFFSGIPTVEKRMDERFGKGKEYLEYKRRTSVLIPWPPRKR